MGHVKPCQWQDVLVNSQICLCSGGDDGLPIGLYIPAGWLLTASIRHVDLSFALLVYRTRLTVGPMMLFRRFLSQDTTRALDRSNS